MNIMGNNMIKFENVSKNYVVGNHTIYALREIKLEIREGDFICIVGPSGSGKTTLLNIIGCLDTPTSGKHLLRGIDVTKMSDHELSILRNRAIGFVFQRFHLLPYSVLYNMSLPLIYSHKSKNELSERINKTMKMLKLENFLHKKTGELSAGEQQRIALARAIVNNPDLICADEPTGNLDEESAFEIANLLKRLNKSGKTIVLVTHNPEIAKFAQTTYVLKGGILKH